MTADDGDARVGAEAVEIGTAASARVRDVRQVRVGDVAVGRAGRTVRGAVLCPAPPRVVFPVAVAITYWTLALLPAGVLRKCAAAFTASAASCDCDGRDGAEAALSDQTPASMPDGLPAAVPAPLQKKVPLATPWQYWVTLFNQGLPPTPV